MAQTRGDASTRKNAAPMLFDSCATSARRRFLRDGVERGPHPGEDQSVGRALVDIRRVSVKDRAIFLDEGFDVAGELRAVAVHFDLFDGGMGLL